MHLVELVRLITYTHVLSASSYSPKFDPSEVKIIYLRATGGEVGASSALAPKIGPLGLVRRGDTRTIYFSRSKAYATITSMPLIITVTKGRRREHRQEHRRMERSPSHCPINNSKSTSSRLSRSISIISRYPSIERTSPRPKEGEEHQT